MKNFSDVLSIANKEKCIKLLSLGSSSNFIVPKTSFKAAVLVPLCEYNNELSFLYTVRALNLKANGGEVSFPGGRFDESDGTLERTALREAHEEVGIPPSKVDIWGKAAEVHRTDITITPVLGYIRQFNVTDLRINPTEVSSVFTVSLENLCSKENFRFTRFRFGKSHIMKTPVYNVHETRIWGLTAYITHIILSSLVPDVYKKNIKFKPNFEKRLV